MFLVFELINRSCVGSVFMLTCWGCVTTSIYSFSWHETDFSHCQIYWVWNQLPIMGPMAVWTTCWGAPPTDPPCQRSSPGRQPLACFLQEQTTWAAAVMTRSDDSVADLEPASSRLLKGILVSRRLARLPGALRLMMVFITCLEFSSCNAKW